jgi:hypothetical protein
LPFFAVFFAVFFFAAMMRASPPLWFSGARGALLYASLQSSRRLRRTGGYRALPKGTPDSERSTSGIFFYGTIPPSLHRHAEKKLKWGPAASELAIGEVDINFAQRLLVQRDAGRALLEVKTQSDVHAASAIEDAPEARIHRVRAQVKHVLELRQPKHDDGHPPRPGGTWSGHRRDACRCDCGCRRRGGWQARWVRARDSGKPHVHIDQLRPIAGSRDAGLATLRCDRHDSESRNVQAQTCEARELRRRLVHIDTIPGSGQQYRVPRRTAASRKRVFAAGTRCRGT